MGTLIDRLKDYFTRLATNTPELMQLPMIGAAARVYRDNQIIQQPNQTPAESNNPANQNKPIDLSSLEINKHQEIVDIAIEKNIITKDEINTEFLCQIGFCIMENPVRIQKVNLCDLSWLIIYLNNKSSNRINPFNRKQFEIDDIVIEYKLKFQIDRFIQDLEVKIKNIPSDAAHIEQDNNFNIPQARP